MRVAPMRARLFFYACMIVALFLTYRLCMIQAINGASYARQALAQRSDTVEVFARRGSILDRYGNVLVRSLPSQSVYAVPKEILQPDVTIAKLRSIVGPLDPAAADALHDRHRWFVWIARKVPHDAARRIAALNLPGIALKEEDTGLRVDSAGRLASTLLGFVGTDENGLDGVEYAYDSLLRGRSGRITLEADQFGRPIPFGLERTITPAQPGMTLALTIDPYLQFVAERALARQVQAFHALDGTAIVMDPWTGEILALANLPNFEPNRFWKYSDDQRRDRAVMDAYEPGSTYKLVTAAAALDSGKVTLASRFPARDAIVVGGRTIHNAEDGFMAGTGASETLGEIVELSHNVGAAEVGLSIGPKTFYSMERKAGFGVATDVGLPGENPGIVPPPSQWSASSLATMSFGQGVSVTPLAMARYYCAIANGGLLMQPRVVGAAYDQHGTLVQRFGPKVVRRVFSRRTARELREFLRRVVLHGTGNPTAQIPGYATAGKTGTAQMVVDGEYRAGYYAASFIGMVPYPRARYLIYVKVERPIGSYYGSVVAAPAFAAIAREAMLHAGVVPTPDVPHRGK
ncbi:MAG: penicillin-binding protein 2 [Candidatus Eremiobacteraeota bacterium]|nr:penicillin-binding protein 2 [Candidatus Eremiobacteraeota bacterium]MBV9264242.1 penicillin-binding protein 2 [Candidatus Eremiobacteraeota bacterium]